jgi:hypothetical protein
MYNQSAMATDPRPQGGHPARSQRAGIEFLMRAREIGITFAKIVITEQRFGSHDHPKQAQENHEGIFKLPAVSTKRGGLHDHAERREIQEKRGEFENLIAQFWN